MSQQIPYNTGGASAIAPTNTYRPQVQTQQSGAYALHAQNQGPTGGMTSITPGHGVGSTACGAPGQPTQDGSYLLSGPPRQAFSNRLHQIDQQTNKPVQYEQHSGAADYTLNSQPYHPGSKSSKARSSKVPSHNMPNQTGQTLPAQTFVGMSNMNGNRQLKENNTSATATITTQEREPIQRTKSTVNQGLNGLQSGVSSSSGLGLNKNEPSTKSMSQQLGNVRHIQQPHSTTSQGLPGNHRGYGSFNKSTPNTYVMRQPMNQSQNNQPSSTHPQKTVSNLNMTQNSSFGQPYPKNSLEPINSHRYPQGQPVGGAILGELQAQNDNKKGIHSSTVQVGASVGSRACSGKSSKSSNTRTAQMPNQFYSRRSSNIQYAQTQVVNPNQQPQFVTSQNNGQGIGSTSISDSSQSQMMGNKRQSQQNRQQRIKPNSNVASISNLMQSGMGPQAGLTLQPTLAPVKKDLNSHTSMAVDQEEDVIDDDVACGEVDFEMLPAEKDQDEMGRHLVENPSALNGQAGVSLTQNIAQQNQISMFTGDVPMPSADDATMVQQQPVQSAAFNCLDQQDNQNVQSMVDNCEPEISQKLQALQDFLANHPTMHLSRDETTEIERQNLNVKIEYGVQIDLYMRELESLYQTGQSLDRHKITPALRARMIDWMIEVLTNFKCDDQTFFLAVSLIDRFMKNRPDIAEIGDLHIMGVTAMFIASKYEDIYPLKMKMVYEKIAHKKIPIEKIKALELDYLKVIKYKISAPTILDFLKIYLRDVLAIPHLGNTSLRKEEKEALPRDSETPEGQRLLVLKMSLYLGKMSAHDYEMSGRKPSLVAVGCLYVALKICEQLKRTSLITNQIVQAMVNCSRCNESDIIEVSQKVLYLAQNFDKVFPQLENLKKTHFVAITQLL